MGLPSDWRKTSAEEKQSWLKGGCDGQLLPFCPSLCTTRRSRHSHPFHLRHATCIAPPPLCQRPPPPSVTAPAPLYCTKTKMGMQENGNKHTSFLLQRETGQFTGRPTSLYTRHFAHLLLSTAFESPTRNHQEDAYRSSRPTEIFPAVTYPHHDTKDKTKKRRRENTTHPPNTTGHTTKHNQP